jgi:hypothetical protein
MKQLPLLLILLLSAAAQVSTNNTSTTQANATPVKNPQALALLARMMAATGWSGIIHDAVAQGTMTNSANPSAQGRRFTLTMRGRKDFRFDSTDGSSSTILSSLSGVIVRGDKVTPLPVHVATDRGFSLPMLSLLADSAANDVDLTMGDGQQVNGVACTEVRLARRVELSALSKVLSRISDATVCISPDGLPLRVRHTRASLENQTATFEETIAYSDFRSVNGALVPFRQEVFFDGQPTTTIQFDSITFNSAPPDQLFRIPAASTAGGAR